MAVYLICYVISFVLARQHVYMLSGLVLMAAAVWLYGRDYVKTGNLIHLRGLFCLFFVGGQGISCFKLSRLQTDWCLETWICLALAVAAFWVVFEVLTRMYDGWTAADMQSVYRWFASPESPLQAKRLLKAMGAVTVVSYLAFFFEAFRLGFVPLFSYGVPHAYSYFHVTGVHYFTVSCVLVPSLFVVYSLMIVRRGRGLFRDGGFFLGTSLYCACPFPSCAVCVQVSADPGRGNGSVHLYFHDRLLPALLWDRSVCVPDPGLSGPDSDAQPQCRVSEWDI